MLKAETIDATKLKMSGTVEATDASKVLGRLWTRTLWQMLVDSADADPDRYALVGADDSGDVRRITYRELVNRADAASVGLAAIGVRRGDRVVLWMTNSIEWVVSAFATLRLGAVLVPVNTFLKAEEVRYFVAQSGARHLITIDRFRKLDMPGILADFCPGFASQTAPGQLYDPAVPDLRNVVMISRFGGRHKGAYDFSILGRHHPDARALADEMAANVKPTDLAMIKYTSGSTAFPKGAMLEHGGFVANGILHGRRMTACKADIYFSSMPFYHAGGSIFGMMTMLTCGGTLVFTEAFNADLSVDLILQEKATIFSTLLAEEIVQAALRRGITLPSVRLASVPDEAARKVLPNVKSSFAAFGLTEGYGCCAMVNYRPGENPGAGKILEGNEARIIDPETGNEQPPGVPGELLVRGMVARSYWNRPEETLRAFDKDGWLHTEDLVSIDPEGILRWHGRLKLMIKVGGENVSLEDIERVVESHEGVFQCGAVGLKDARKAEAVGVYVVRAPQHELTESALREWLEVRLARFKIPREIVFVDELPRLGNGKLARLELSHRAEIEFPLEPSKTA